MVKLLDIMPEEAKNTNFPSATIAGLIDRSYMIRQGGILLRLDDSVNAHCYGRSHWHTDAFDIWSLPQRDRKAAQGAALLAIRDRIFPVIHPRRSTGNISFMPNGTLGATSPDFYGGMEVQVLNVLANLERLIPMANHFVTFGVTKAFSSNLKGDHMLPDMSGINVLRHFLIDMLDPFGTYNSVYWIIMRRCLQDRLARKDPVLATVVCIHEGSRLGLAMHEAMLHGDYESILGKSLLNTYHGGLEYMYTSHALPTVRPAAPRNDDLCILYGIVFDHETIRDLRVRIGSLLRSSACTRPQKVHGISRKAGVPAMSSAILDAMVISSQVSIQ